MTCVIGAIDRENKKVFMGSDKNGCTDDFQTEYQNPKILKIEIKGQRTNNKKNVLIGLAGNYRALNLIEVNSHYLFSDCNLDNIYAEEAHINLKFLIKYFVPKLQVLLKDIEKKELPELLIAVEDRLYIMQSDYSILVPGNEFAVIGSAEEYAIGAMDILTYHQMFSSQINLRITCALETASRYGPGIGSNFDILST